MHARKTYHGRMAREVPGWIGMALVVGSALVWVWGESWMPPLSQEVTALQERPAPSQVTIHATLTNDKTNTPAPPLADAVIAPLTPEKTVPDMRALQSNRQPAVPTASVLPSPPPITATFPAPTARFSAPTTAREKEATPTRSGELDITGLVLTDKGRPVSDLEVTASVNRLFENDTSGPRATKAYHARTNQDGVFEFQELWDGEYTLQTVPTPPYEATSKRVRAGIEEVTLVVAEGKSQKVNGLVKQAGSGAPLGGVTVVAANQTTASDDAGRYELAVHLAGQGPTLLRFTHPAYREQQITVPAQGRQTEQALTLKDVTMEAVQGRATVTGLVEHQLTGKPLPGMRVFLSPAKGPGQMDTLTGQDGIFRFSAVPWGTYTMVVAPKTGYQDLTHPNLEVTETGVEHLQLRLTPLPNIALTGHFLDPAGQPVRGLTLWLTSRTVRTYTGIPVTSDPSGYFSIQNVPAGELELATRSDPYLTMSGLTLPAGGSAPVQLPVDWGLQILTGLVVTAGGLPVPGADVILSWTQTVQGVTSRSIRHSLADASGTFRFTQLGPGQHTLNVSAPGYARTILEHQVGPALPTVQVTLAARAS